MKERHEFDRTLNHLIGPVTPCGRGCGSPRCSITEKSCALAAARDIENAKAAKYRSVAMERGATFSAFIVESYGALGGQGLELLKLLNSTLNHAPARPFELSERVVAETFSVALQRGNAFISHTGSLTARAQAVSGRGARATQSDTASSNRMVEVVG